MPEASLSARCACKHTRHSALPVGVRGRSVASSYRAIALSELGVRGGGRCTLVIIIDQLSQGRIGVAAFTACTGAWLGLQPSAQDGSGAGDASTERLSALAEAVAMSRMRQTGRM